jgi:hypothetical protein
MSRLIDMNSIAISRTDAFAVGGAILVVLVGLFINFGPILPPPVSLGLWLAGLGLQLAAFVMAISGGTGTPVGA